MSCGMADIEAQCQRSGTNALGSLIDGSRLRRPLMSSPSEIPCHIPIGHAGCSLAYSTTGSRKWFGIPIRL